jgi:hypothetical protein
VFEKRAKGFFLKRFLMALFASEKLGWIVNCKEIDFPPAATDWGWNFLAIFEWIMEIHDPLKDGFLTLSGIYDSELIAKNFYSLSHDYFRHRVASLEQHLTLSTAASGASTRCQRRTFHVVDLAILRPMSQLDSASFGFVIEWVRRCQRWEIVARNGRPSAGKKKNEKSSSIPRRLYQFDCEHAKRMSQPIKLSVHR